MPANRSYLAFPEVAQAFDRAIAHKPGILLTFQDKKARDQMVWRCYRYRTLIRAENRILYPDPGHTMHGRSIYDKLGIYKQGDFELRIQEIVPNFETIEL